MAVYYELRISQCENTTSGAARSEQRSKKMS
jgi:hypothetical protein